MIVQIKSLYNGQIPLRDKYVDKAIKDQDFIIAVADGKAYHLSFEELQKPVYSIMVDDKFSTKKQKLYYFKAPGPQTKPREETIKQGQLL